MTKKRIFALAAVIFGLVSAFPLLALGSHENTGGTFTLTGIPSEYNGKYALCYAESPNSGWYVIGAREVISPDNFRLLQVQGGSATFSLRMVDGLGVGSSYTGGDTLDVVIRFFDQAAFDGWESTDKNLCAAYFYSNPFSNGSAEREWRSADFIQ